MQPYLVSVVLLLFSAALQGAWPSWFRFGAQPPELVLTAVVCIGLTRGATEGCLAGLIGALLMGGTAHTPLGGMFVGYMVAGACAGFLRGSLLSERLLVAVLVVASAVVLSQFLRMIFMPPPEFAVWFKGVLSAAAFSAVISPLTFWISRFANPREVIH